jgi:hypothetical protein
MPIGKHREFGALQGSANQPMNKAGEPPLALELITFR